MENETLYTDATITSTPQLEVKCNCKDLQAKTEVTTAEYHVNQHGSLRVNSVNIHPIEFFNVMAELAKAAEAAGLKVTNVSVDRW